MEIAEFKRILAAFADEPTDVDVRLGKVVAQIRDDIIDVSIAFSQGEDRTLHVVENEVTYPARQWLLQRVARLPQLAERIINVYSSPGSMDLSSSFVVPEGSLSADLSTGNNEETKVVNVVEQLLERASGALPGATSVLYLTSDAGEGKTTIFNQAALTQARRYKQKAASSIILPIPLGGRSFLTFDDAVIAALVNKFRFNYLYFDAFVELVKMGAIVPAFDGYEEMLVEGSKNEAVSALGNLVQRLESSGSIFIAARKAFFEYLSFKTQARLLDAIGDHSAAFSRLGIARWSKHQFCEYGVLRGSEKPSAIYETVAARLGVDHPLLTRAVLVRRLFDVTAGLDNTETLVDLLGANPHDYFYTFVDAIVKREASEKWLSRVSGDVMRPLLTSAEHHDLLAVIAQEMWQSSASSLRHDVIDVLVDIFSESRRKNAGETRQIKERLKQHSLLVADTSRGLALGFDHEDFQNFYVGEALGRLLAQSKVSDLQTFLAIDVFSSATVEQSVHYLIRHDVNLQIVADAIDSVNASEAAFSFCKENCGMLALRIAECKTDEGSVFQLSRMFFGPDALAGRSLSRLTFVACHFQPTAISNGLFSEVLFEECEFERIETRSGGFTLAGTEFRRCKVDSVVVLPEDEHTYEPSQAVAWLRLAGAHVAGAEPQPAAPSVADDRFKLLERFLRVFLRNTQVEESIIRLRLGNSAAPRFFEEILPLLLANGILEPITWKGRGTQNRYKLTRAMSEIGEALERADGSFEKFLEMVI